MTNRLRDLFDPTVKKKIERLNFIISLYRDQFGQCSTCIYYKDTDMPGFVTDYGECKKSHPIFIEKVISRKNIICDGYEENKITLKKMKKELKELKRRNE